MGAPVTALSRQGAGFELTMGGGDTLKADAVVLATAAHVSARLLEPEDERLSQHLEAIPYGSSVTVALAYRREEIPLPLDAFGFVVPTIEGRNLMACTWSSVKWPGRAPEGMVLLRCFLGGEGRDHAADLDEESLLADCRRELKRLMGIQAEPSLVRVDRHRQVMPRYRVGHLVRAEQIEARVAGLPRLELAGGFTRGVGIPDSVKSGEAAAESLAAELG
jgi:oxygen-dependent protoporphyrinogen oxidase